MAKKNDTPPPRQDQNESRSPEVGAKATNVDDDETRTPQQESHQRSSQEEEVLGIEIMHGSEPQSPLMGTRESPTLKQEHVGVKVMHTQKTPPKDMVDKKKKKKKKKSPAPKKKKELQGSASLETTLSAVYAALEAVWSTDETLHAHETTTTPPPPPTVDKGGTTQRRPVSEPRGLRYSLDGFLYVDKAAPRRGAARVEPDKSSPLDKSSFRRHAVFSTDKNNKNNNNDDKALLLQERRKMVETDRVGPRLEALDESRVPLDARNAMETSRGEMTTTTTMEQQTLSSLTRKEGTVVSGSLEETPRDDNDPVVVVMKKKLLEPTTTTAAAAARDKSAAAAAAVVTLVVPRSFILLSLSSSLSITMASGAALPIMWNSIWWNTQARLKILESSLQEIRERSLFPDNDDGCAVSSVFLG